MTGTGGNDWVLSCDRLGAEQGEQAGGKGATLARLRQRGYPVPSGFIVLPSAFVGDELKAEAWARVREELARLRRKKDSVGFAVRSSALAEDSASASFAGQFQTLLGVRGDKGVHDAIREVRRSRHSGRVRAYSKAKGIEAVHEMAVIVQRMVPAELSGILFTADPLTGSRREMSGSFAAGLGDQLVSGEATGESFKISRPTGIYSGPGLLERHARRLYRLGERLDKELDQPQDIEWAVAGGKIFLLQSRAITTLAGYDPAIGEWNASRTGDFLWSNVNFGEAVSGVMTPLTWTVIERLLADWMFLPGHHSAGNIGGRPYFNLSIFATVFHAMGKSTEELLETLEPTVYTPLPEGMEIPLLPLPVASAARYLPRWARIELRQRRGVRALAKYVRTNRAWCLQARESIRGTRSGPELLALWQREILPHVNAGVWIVLGSATHFARLAAPLRRELVALVGPVSADTLLTGPAGEGADLPANLGPLVGIDKVARGEMDREVYLDRYGHRGPHEFELSCARPREDPEWVERQVTLLRESPVDVEGLLEERRARFEVAWEQLLAHHPRRARRVGKLIEKAATRSWLREAARSEYVRDRWMVREVALRAGELTGLGDDVFFLTIEELERSLAGEEKAADRVALRRAAYARQSALPPYPSVIRGRFDPYRWAEDPDRSPDLFDSHRTAGRTSDREGNTLLVNGAPGSAGFAEGVVRRLGSPAEGDRLRDGEILVTRQTDIEWTLLFPRAGAVVTDVGAPLSHAAIVARELGIPAVVGCGDAFNRLRTGDRVAVDGGRGTVRLLDGSGREPDPNGLTDA
jgi:pyruvate,water dikinase